MGLFKIRPHKRKEHREGQRWKKEARKKTAINGGTIDSGENNSDMKSLESSKSKCSQVSVRFVGQSKAKFTLSKMRSTSSSASTDSVRSCPSRSSRKNCSFRSVQEPITATRTRRVHCAAPGGYEGESDLRSNGQEAETINPICYEKTARARLVINEPGVEYDERNEAIDKLATVEDNENKEEEEGLEEDKEEEEREEVEEGAEEEEEDIPDLEVTRCDLQGDVKDFVVKYIEEHFESESPVGSLSPMVEELDKKYGANWQLDHISDEEDTFQDKEAVPGSILMYHFEGRSDYYVLYRGVPKEQPLSDNDDVDDYPE
ncbi:unnamed protein product [Calicophoron daubneyi]|uniref:Uncharacterized protein n=1 Tax=Calicophoron daubneyi TaxID=300641 RepID=A0AAV2TQN2_CALDB